MKQLILLSFLLLGFSLSHAQKLTMPADGGSVRAQVSETIGITKITIDYGRPAVKGREGKIWGGLIQEGTNNPGGVPWRAGANENTTIEFSTEVLIGGHKLLAGKYGFHILYHPDICTLILCKNTEAWGSYFYNENDDVIRFMVKPIKLANSQERLLYTFSGETDSSVIITLIWEKLAIPFTVTTELQKLMVASIEKEMNSVKIFDAQNYIEAAKYYTAHNIHPDKALAYAKLACNSLHNLNSAVVLHDVLVKAGQTKQADSILNDATRNADLIELHQYARSVMATGNNQKAMELFKLNYSKYPKNYTSNIGMVRGYSALGEFKSALKYANKALPMAPDAANKQYTEQMIAMLKQGKNIN